MRTYTVADNDMISSSTLLLTLERDDSERPLAFEPGQYAAINFNHNGRPSVTRCFSIVSSPTEQHILQFSMRVRGRFTTAVSNLQKGDVVHVAGPFGGFALDTIRDRQAVFLAGGIGITPFISMMRYLAALNATNDITLLYSCTNQDDVPFAQELVAIQLAHPNLKTIFVVGQGAIDKLPPNTTTGFINEPLLDAVTQGNYANGQFFICGPPGFMNAMTKIIFKRGVPKNRILTEAFTQSSPKQTSILRSWPANAYALGAVGLIFGSVAVTVGDLLKALPPTTVLRPTKTAPFLITNARQEELDALVNSVAPSPNLIKTPANGNEQATSPAISSQHETIYSSGQAPAPAATTPSSGSTTPAPTPTYTPPAAVTSPTCVSTPSKPC